MLCGAEDWPDVEEFGRSRADWLPGFLQLPGGIPSHDTFRRVFGLLDRKQFAAGLFHWTQALHAAIGGKVIAIDAPALGRLPFEETFMTSVIAQHITKTPGVCGGRACIAGHRIRVMDIVVWHEKRGYSPDEIVDMFPGITLADVYAALAYYFDNRQEIDDEFGKDNQWAGWVEANIPSKIPPGLKEKAGG